MLLTSLASSCISQYQSWNYVHGHQLVEIHESGISKSLAIDAHLLEQQLGGVRDSQLSHFLGTFAVRAPSVVSHKPALLTRVDFEFIRGDHKTFQEELSGAIANQAVSFHFTET